jgi:pantoate--beta-alanine ligase
MKIFRNRKSFQKWRSSLRAKAKLGFVPTMGALHDGHLSLVKKIQKKCDQVVVSIFVNPTQFGPNEDFDRYPRTEKADLALLQKLGVDAVFMPSSPAEIYDGDTKVIPREYLLRILEAKIRPGHFEGVATVVLKLFQIVNPSVAIFGEKDYQQLQVIRAMVEDLFLPVQILSGPTLREKDGLAMSSRNRFLSESERKLAAEVYRVLRSSPTIDGARAELMTLGFQLDYLKCFSKDLREERPDGQGRWLVAVRMNKVRLIDNIAR